MEGQARTLSSSELGRRHLRNKYVMAERFKNISLAALDGPRALSAEEHASAADLINLTLRSGKPPTILKEYPLVLGKDNLRNMRVISHEGRVVSHAAVYYSKLRTGDLIFKVGGIGSVATHPAYQGKGLGGAIIEDCLKTMKDAGCHLSILWTQRHSFYRRHGFELAGSEYLFRLPVQQLKNGRRQCRIADYSPKYLPGIIRIHEREPLRNERTRREYSIYFSLPKAKTLVSLRNGSVSAYAVMGKGEDFQNCIHDWGGHAEDLLCLFRELAASARFTEVTVLTPAGNNHLVDLLQGMHVPRVSEYLAMIQVVRTEHFLPLVRAYLLSKKQEPFHIEADGSGFIILTGSERIVIKDARALVRLIFGPDRFSEMQQNVSAEVLRKLDRAFPIPLFIWGLDSV